MSQLPAPALVLPHPPGSGAAGISLAVRHGASHSWTAAAGLCPIPCCCQWHFSCSRKRAWCGEGSRCMVGIFPASVCAGGGWCRSAELGSLWVQPCLRRPPWGSSGLLTAPESRKGSLDHSTAGRGWVWARGRLCLCQASGMCVLCVPAAPAAARPLSPCHPPTPSQRDFGFPLLCRASVPPSASL